MTTNSAELYNPTNGTKSVGDISLQTTEVLDGGDVAVETGTLSSTAPGEDGSRVSKTGKFIVVWKRDESGSWRIHRDIWNFDA